MKSFLTLDDLQPAGKTVLLRADLNVPMQNGMVGDRTRIKRLVPTLRELAAKGARVVILSHFGRPRGHDSALTLAPVCRVLSEELGQPVTFLDDALHLTTQDRIAGMKDGDVALLENIRFYPEEEKNDPAFAAELAKLGDVYVNDAFSCAHRAHASTHAIAAHLPAYAGRLMEAELDALETALEKPQHPVVALVGGAKISTKLDLLNNLVTKIDTLVLGGGMANTFLAALDNPVGKSLCEREMKEQALAIIDTAQQHNCKILLPVDAVCAEKLERGAQTVIRATGTVQADEMMLDIGPETTAQIETTLQKARTVLWNGPLGVFETPPFDAGTVALARAVAALTAKGQLTSIAGGGDTLAALAHAEVEEELSYISTAGGAFLEWLEGKTLPGVQILQDRARAARAAA